MNQILLVTRPAFDDAFGLLVANFGTQNDLPTLKAIKTLYLRAFTVVDAPADDHILKEAIEGLVLSRTERGMPRLAELREVILRIRERDSLFRAGQHVREALRVLQHALVEDRDSRRATLEQCVENVAATLGRIQKQQADDRLRQQGRRDD